MQELSRIHVRSAAKVTAFIFFILGFFNGLIFFIQIIQAPGARIDVFAFLTPFIIIPISYYIFGLIIGVVLSFTYNKFAGRFGGLKFNLGAPTKKGISVPKTPLINITGKK